MSDAEKTIVNGERKRHSSEHLLSKHRIDWSYISIGALIERDVEPIHNLQESIEQSTDSLKTVKLLADTLELYLQVFCEVMDVDPASFVVRIVDYPDGKVARADVSHPDGPTLFLSERVMYQLSHRLELGVSFYRKFFLEKKMSTGISLNHERILAQYFSPLDEFLGTLVHEMYHFRQQYDPEYMSDSIEANERYQMAKDAISLDLPPEEIAREKLLAYYQHYTADPGEQAARAVELKALVRIYRVLSSVEIDALPLGQQCVRLGLKQAIENVAAEHSRFLNKMSERSVIIQKIKALMGGTKKELYV